jgi:hypothetical protein
MVLAHNIWSGGVLALIVTLVGWVTLIKSLSFLFLPPEIDADCSTVPGVASLPKTLIRVHSYFAGPGRRSDIWRIKIKRLFLMLMMQGIGCIVRGYLLAARLNWRIGCVYPSGEHIFRS